MAGLLLFLYALFVYLTANARTAAIGHRGS
jgi:hypothetical protein